ncbi:MAG: agmatine deiminase family protein [Myxococcales bacterium]|nr:agmatine deiminase family protein [Myxococcales bacterium]
MPLWMVLLACVDEEGDACPGGRCRDSADVVDTGDTGDTGDAPRRRVPAEWEPQAAIWIQWNRRYEQAYEADMARIVAAVLDYEDVHLLVHDTPTRGAAEASLAADGGLSSEVIAGAASAAGFTISWHDIPNDNAWIRDNGPVYVEEDGAVRIQDWGFDGWGGAFGDIAFADDDVVPAAIGALVGLPVDAVKWVHERGNLEFNGLDTVVLNWSTIGDPNRNPGMTREQAARIMESRFGVTRVVIVEGVPEGDLTGGHIDGISRFIDAERIVVADCSARSVCEPGGHDDIIYDAAAIALSEAGLEVIRWPFQTSVRYRGVDLDTDYMNWLVGNDFVIATGFGDGPADAAAQLQLGEWFPGRDIRVIPMLASWYAGGGVHCHTSDQPR